MQRNPIQPTVSVGGVDLSRIEYRGEQVVTFEQVDQVHERPKGTAKSAYRRNRARFVQGEDFIKATRDVWRTESMAWPFEPNAPSVVLLTKRGYLKLVKPMDDDRAWAVQGEMVDRYFAVEQAQMAAKPAGSDSARLQAAREARLTFNNLLKVCRMAGVTGGHALISANKGTQRMVGVDYLDAIGVPRLPSDIGGAQITATDVGRPLGLSDRETNKALTKYEYQIAARTAKGRLVYMLTAKGERHGGRATMTGKKHSDGTPVTQVVWSTATTEALRADMKRGETA